MSRMRNRDAESIPVLAVFLASGAATSAAAPVDQRAAPKGRRQRIEEKKNVKLSNSLLFKGRTA
jgi:hypothetical protein